jgi:hypothetical protein
VSERLRELYADLKSAVAFIEVQDPATGDLGIGTAFHVGEGVFITAAHVVRGKRVTQMGNVFELTRSGSISLPPFRATKAALHFPSSTDGDARELPDVAALVVDVKQKLPALQLGGHLDQWLAKDEMTLSRGLVMGFPPVPFAETPHLLAVTCEVNAHVGLRRSGHPHFLVSSMARGGFSGGPVLHEQGFVLGLVTESLIHNNKPAELGFMTVLTVEPIYDLLHQHGLLPAVQDEDVREDVLVEYSYKGSGWANMLKNGHHGSRKTEALELYSATRKPRQLPKPKGRRRRKA